jgi:hypothetical protein
VEGSAVAGPDQVTGVRETIAALRKVEPNLAREAIRQMKAPAAPAMAALRATAPAAPLSGMGGYGPTKVAAKYGGRQKPGGVWPLLTIRLTATGWTVASDMARNSSPGETMVENLDRKYRGGASRWAWPTVERFAPAMVQGVRLAVLTVERQTNAALSRR